MADERERSQHPELFTTIPEQPKIQKQGQLNGDQLRQYFKDGYVLIPEFFSKDELQPVRDTVSVCVDELANKLYDAGKIKDKHADAGLFKRMTLIEKEFPGATVLLHKRKQLYKGFKDLWTNERLLNAVEQMVGPEIGGHPTWDLRVKTPHNEEFTVPWHQDAAYLDLDAINALVATAWIPLLDTNEVNGCMQVVKGGHTSGILCKHVCCAGNTWYVDLPEEEMEKTLGVNLKEDVVTCEVPYGGVLFINNMVPHRSLENYTQDIRWSLDLRWQNANLPTGHFFKESVLMRTANDPDHVINFDAYCVDKHIDRRLSLMKNKTFDEFDTTMQGTWMLRWGVTHHNRHTANLVGQ